MIRLLAALALSLVALPAHAAVTMVFWSHDLGASFPHAFVTLRGTPDAGGAPVDRAFGFTARSVGPRILFGPVRGKLDIPKPGYIRSSDARFAVVLTDAQYAAIVALARDWGDTDYRLDTHNCVHFVQEAARRAGLTGLDQPRLMKRPRAFLKAIAAANTGRITAPIGRRAPYR